MAIHLGRPLPDASCNLPGRRRENPPARWTEIRPARHPYLVLLLVGFTLPRLSPAARCALTAPFHPYPSLFHFWRSLRAVCFLWHFPWGRPRRALPGTVSPWSPDFPPSAPESANSSHPTVWRAHCSSNAGETKRGKYYLRRTNRKSPPSWPARWRSEY